MRKLRVFVSSALVELEYEREVATEVIRDLRLDPVVFEEFVPMSASLEESYLTAIRDCDVFVMILWRTMRPPVLREYETAVENSKPILLIVKMLRAGEKRTKELDEFLHRRVPGDVTAKSATVPFFKEYRSLADFRECVRQGIIAEIVTAMARQPIMTHTRQEMYELGTSMVRSARRRLYIAQATPSLFFGARKYQYEIDFCNAVGEWVDDAVRNSLSESICLFDVESTRAAIDSEDVREMVRQNLLKLRHAEHETGRRIRIHPAPPRYSGPMGLADNWFAFWLAGTHNAICVSYVDAKIGDAIAQVFRELSSEPLADDQSLLSLGLR